MRKPAKFSIENLIRNDKLKPVHSFGSVIESIFVFAFFLLMILVPFLFYTEIDFYNPNDSFIGWFVLPLSIAVGFYGIFRKLEENRLMKFDTVYSRDQNRRLIESFLEKKRYKIIYARANHLIAVRENDLLITSPLVYKMTIVFDGSLIFVNIARDGERFRMPIFFSHYFIRHDLSNFIDHFLNDEESARI